MGSIVTRDQTLVARGPGFFINPPAPGEKDWPPSDPADLKNDKLHLDFKQVPVGEVTLELYDRDLFRDRQKAADAETKPCMHGGSGGCLLTATFQLDRLPGDPLALLRVVGVKAADFIPKFAKSFKAWLPLTLHWLHKPGASPVPMMTFGYSDIDMEQIQNQRAVDPSRSRRVLQGRIFDKNGKLVGSLASPVTLDLERAVDEAMGKLPRPTVGGAGGAPVGPATSPLRGAFAQLTGYYEPRAPMELAPDRWVWINQALGASAIIGWFGDNELLGINGVQQLRSLPAMGAFTGKLVSGDGKAVGSRWQLDWTKAPDAKDPDDVTSALAGTTKLREPVHRTGSLELLDYVEEDGFAKRVRIRIDLVPPPGDPAVLPGATELALMHSLPREPFAVRKVQLEQFKAADPQVPLAAWARVTSMVSFQSSKAVQEAIEHITGSAGVLEPSATQVVAAQAKAQKALQDALVPVFRLNDAALSNEARVRIKRYMRWEMTDKKILGENASTYAW